MDDMTLADVGGACGGRARAVDGDVLDQGRDGGVRRPLATRADVAAFVRSVVRLGILGRERFHYWTLLSWTLLRRPKLVPLAVTLAIGGYHFRKICEKQLLS